MMTPVTLIIDRPKGRYRHRADCPCDACAPADVRLWRRVEITDGCWLWQGRVGTHGYGMLSHNGKLTTAHRVSYVLKYGDIPSGMIVCHHCDVRRCVNPEHLFLGTHLDNMRDCVAKGRHVAAPNVGMTHCSRGHEYTPANTYTYKRRGMTCRNCRACQRERMVERRRQGRAQ